MSVVILSRSSGPLYVLAFAAGMTGMTGLVFSFGSSAVFAPPAPETLVRLSRLPASPVPVTVSGARTGRTYYAGRVTPAQAACLAKAVAPMPGDPRLVRTPQYEPVRVRAGTPEQARLISSALTDIDNLRRGGTARCRAFRTSGGVTFEQPTLTGLNRSGGAASSAVTLPRPAPGSISPVFDCRATPRRATLRSV